jgi:superfamily II DNA or RNA helicase
VSSSGIQTKILRRKATPQEYRVYRAGLEWDLTDPIVINKRDDLKSEHRWRGRFEPYHHQVTNLITFCRRLPVTLLADDVGLGKTISAGLIISELIARSRLSKVLVVCPKLLGPQWREELLTKFNIISEIAIGKELFWADPRETGAVITTYNSARLYLDQIPRDRFQMLVLDEAHKLRNLFGVENPPQVATCFRDTLEQRRFQFVLMLTATPIQNRLWDLYSLVDLLTVARGHQNPFGSEGLFVRKFIADGREQARQLRPEARNEFRSIVYGYMSRVRRGDARLFFPDRVVQMHRVNPTRAELELIGAIAKPIQNLNRLAQISILQALTSSPDALMVQLNNMARNGTVPEQLAATVRSIVREMPTSAKLLGLGGLIDRLMQENQERWRLVVFTGRLETQTTIQAFLEGWGLKVGIINGASGQRNQETLGRFKRNPPDCHVIVSTEAGSEGINLQVANVLVNYDLPWNPMIVEQRIGRVQRLASEHASVGIFNIMLRGTFEEYIVGRLMEKLQMAAHAIGDIESLLEASGINGEDENGATSFDEKIRQLVVAALAGKDVEAATRQTEQSISNAKSTLEREEASINAMLGGMDGIENPGPRAPTLPVLKRSMAARDFTLAALESLGNRVTPLPSGLFLAEGNGRREFIRTEENIIGERRSTLYAPGTAPFQRLVGEVIATGVYEIEDLDQNPLEESEAIARVWVLGFGGTYKTSAIERVQRRFDGTAVVRVRATVAHDSYERLVEVHCSTKEHQVQTGISGLVPLAPTIESPAAVGLNVDNVTNAAKLDGAISEFSRFYLERRAQEVAAAGDDQRKQKKLEDDFTPRLEMSLVALEGKMHRELEVKAQYRFDDESIYSSTLTIIPHKGQLVDQPAKGLCARTNKNVPVTCLGQCEITGKTVLQHLLARSEVSSRLALPECTVVCSLSGKRILKDEAEISAVSGNLVAGIYLRTSAMSGKRAEPAYFGQCEFTKAVVLSAELATSEISGKRYRADEEIRSAVSGRRGHKQEFVVCHETRQIVASTEAERCEVTGEFVRPGILEPCAITQKRVLPSELLRCAVTGKRALKKLLVTSSLSGTNLLEEVAVRSAKGTFCTPVETKPCVWSGARFHPDDLRLCGLTGLAIHFEFATEDSSPRLKPLAELLDGTLRTADEPGLWDELKTKTELALERGRCKIEAAVLSPDRKHLAVCVEVRTLLGLRVRHAGLLYAIGGNSIVGRVAHGQRTADGWSVLKR